MREEIREQEGVVTVDIEAIKKQRITNKKIQKVASMKNLLKKFSGMVAPRKPDDEEAAIETSSTLSLSTRTSDSV